MQLKEFIRFRKNPERGASDMDAIWIVAVAIVVMTIAYLVLDWVKRVKDQKLENNRSRMMKVDDGEEPKYERRGYQVKF